MVQLPAKPFDVIEYLVARRFPVGAFIPAGLGLSPADPLEQERQKAEQFRSEIQRSGPGRIQELLVQEWNDKPVADFIHHAKLSYWSLDEALALSFGKEPASVSWNAIQPFAGRLAYATEFAKRREIILRAQQMGQLWEQTIPYVFVAWAGRMSFPMPEGLVAEIKGLGIQIRDWKSAHDEEAQKLSEARAQIGRLGQEILEGQREHLGRLKEVTDGWEGVVKKKDDLTAVMQTRIDQLVRRNDELEKTSTASLTRPEPSTRERQSLLKLALGMAVRKYRYDPAATKNAAVANIANDLRETGIPLDEDTIRKYLNEGKELLP